MSKFYIVLQTVRAKFLGSIISVKNKQKDGNIYGKINDKQN